MVERLYWIILGCTGVPNEVVIYFTKEYSIMPN